MEIKDFVVMQSTGLKDKHGKEIFEGDLVKVYNEVVREVVFKNAFWQMEERDMIAANVLGGFGTPQEETEAHKPLYRYSEKNIEIIGNIYQNPDLLKK